jgi:hypothetical protein
MHESSNQNHSCNTVHLTEISKEFSTPYEHEQNSLVKSYIKRLQHVARTLLMQCNLPMESWAHAIMHASDILSYWSHSTLDYESLARLSLGLYHLSNI